MAPYNQSFCCPSLCAHARCLPTIWSEDSVRAMTMASSNHVLDFLHETTANDLPPAVTRQAERCLLDLVGVAAGGRTTVRCLFLGLSEAARSANRSVGLPTVVR